MQPSELTPNLRHTVAIQEALSMTANHPFTDPTAAALAKAMPVLTQPYQGTSSDIEEFFTSAARDALIIGCNGVFMGITRPWLAATLPIVSCPIPAPYGAVRPMLSMRCGRIPAELLDQAVEIFREALPNEAGIFIIWHQGSREFRLERAEEISASPSHLEYRPPVLDDCEHIVVDIHSHGAATAFWSSTDNADDQHHTRLCAVYGSLSRDVSTFTSAARICANKVIVDIGSIPAQRDGQPV